MLYGVDLHPSFQAGISIPQVRNEGHDFLICKLSQGTSATPYAGSIPWMRQAQQDGMFAMGYHYLMDGNPLGQAAVFASQLKAAGVSGAIDVENGSGNLDNVHTFYNECKRLGARISLLYLPAWYWKLIGRPNMSGLPPLWSSRYPDNTVGTPAQNYSRVPSSYWDGYGGLDVAVLQFTSSGKVAGHVVDCNAFRGTRDQFATLVSSPLQTGFLMALNDAEQAELLASVRNINAQIFSGPDPKNPGWPAFPGGTPGTHTVVDYLRNNDVLLHAVKAELDAMKSTAPTAGTAPQAGSGITIEMVTEAITSALSTLQLRAV